MKHYLVTVPEDAGITPHDLLRMLRPHGCVISQVTAEVLPDGLVDRIQKLREITPEIAPECRESVR